MATPPSLNYITGPAGQTTGALVVGPKLAVTAATVSATTNVATDSVLGLFDATAPLVVGKKLLSSGCGASVASPPAGTAVGSGLTATELAWSMIRVGPVVQLQLSGILTAVSTTATNNTLAITFGTLPLTVGGARPPTATSSLGGHAVLSTGATATSSKGDIVIDGTTIKITFTAVGTAISAATSWVANVSYITAA